MGVLNSLAVAAGSSLDGSTVGEVERAGNLRVLACAGRRHLPPSYPIGAGDKLAVVGIREACELLQRAP